MFINYSWLFLIDPFTIIIIKILQFVNIFERLIHISRCSGMHENFSTSPPSSCSVAHSYWRVLNSLAPGTSPHHQKLWSSNWLPRNLSIRKPKCWKSTLSMRRKTSSRGDPSRGILLQLQGTFYKPIISMYFFI